MTEEALLVVNEETCSNWFGCKATQHGGPVIFGFKIARLIGCLILFALSLATLLGSIDSNHQELMWDWGRIFLVDNFPQIAMAVTFVRIITNFPPIVLTRPTVVYLLPRCNFSCSHSMEPICDAPQQFCFIRCTRCLRLS